jgi:hypothetical protein
MPDRGRARHCAAQLLKTALDLDSIRRLKSTVSPESVRTLEDTRDAILRIDRMGAKFFSKAKASKRPEMWKALSAAADKKYYDTLKGGMKRLAHHPLRYLGAVDEPGDHTLKLSSVLKLALGPGGSAALNFATGLSGGFVPGANSAISLAKAPGDVSDIANIARSRRGSDLAGAVGGKALDTGSEITGNVVGKALRQKAPALAEGAANVAGRVLPKIAPYIAKAAPVLERLNPIGAAVTGAQANLQMMAGIDGKVRNALTNPSQSAIDATMKTPAGQSMLGQAWKRTGEERKANPVDASGKRYGVFNPQAPAAPAGWDAPGGLPMAPSAPAKPPAFKPPASVTPPPAFKPPAPLNAPGVPSATKPAGMTAAPGPKMTAAPMQKHNAESTFLGWLESHG